MIIASHVIFGTYGFWLPNDPRGSWSDFVQAYEIYRAGGPATKVATRRSVAGKAHDWKLRGTVKESLKYPAVHLNEQQRNAIANGFRVFADKNELRILACAVLPDHAHLLTARYSCEVEQVATLLKGAATRELEAAGIHPMTRFPRKKNGRLPSCWARGEWKVFLDRVDDIPRVVQYIEANPVKEKLPAQHWNFVTDWRMVFDA